MRKLYTRQLLSLLFLFISFTSFAQITLSGTNYTENFDNISTGLPAGWTVRSGATASNLGTIASMNNHDTTWASTNGIFKNFASADGMLSSASATEQNASTDRALGVRQTGTFADPGAAFVLELNNTTGLSAFTLSFELQSLDITSTRTTSWRVDYGTGASPSSFTVIRSVTGDTTGGLSFSNKTINVDFGTALDNLSGPVWIRIVAVTASTHTGSRPSTGIDDFTLNYTNDGTVTTNVSVSGGANAAEPSTDGSFSLSLSSAPASPVTITYDFTGSTATPGTDFTDAGSGSITIPAGQTSATIPIHVLDDASVEAPETIKLNLLTATAPYTITIGTATINLTSDDISIASFTGNYSQDFNTLASSGTGTFISLPAGWQFSETGANADLTYAASDGNSNSGNTYSFGTTANSDRAMGMLRSSTLIPIMGTLFLNNTGATVTSLTITYTGEQWRLGTTGRQDRMDFQYSVNATSLTTGTWTDANGLDFIAPNSSGTAGAFDGNAAANRVTYTYTINGLSIANGALFAIRWTDLDVTGAEDGLAVDDFTMTLGCTPPTNQPTSLTLTPSLQSIDGSFTAADPGTTTADAYLVLMSTAATLTDMPASGTVYAVDDVIGNAKVVSISGTSFTASGLTPSTTYYFFVFSTAGTTCYNVNSSLTGSIATNSPPACTPPVTQASNLASAAITGTSIDFTWTRGSGDNILVLAHSGAPVDATLYNSLSYPQGTVVGTGNTVIYNGPAAAFSYTGLNQNTTYYFALYEYTSSTLCYLSPALTGSFTTLCTDPVNVSALGGTAGNATATVSWTLPGSGCFDEIIVVASTASITGVGSDYTGTANTVYAGGEQVVYRGTGTSVTISSLANNTTYYFKVFTRKGSNYSSGVQISVIPFDPSSGYVYLYGNLHSHSSYSDGNKDDVTKTPVNDFAFARDALCMDFLGISEHNHSGAGMSYPHFAQGYAEANSINGVAGPGGNSIVTLWGMEWGVISGGGHVLVYGFDDKLLGWESGNYDIFVAKSDYASLWNTVNSKSGAFATLAHPNTTDFTNLGAGYDATADAAIAGQAVESGPAFSTATTYNDFPSSLGYLSYYRNMLAKGYHLAPQMDQDNHNLTFGTANSNRMVILSSGRSREAIMEAVRAMRYYASEDCNMRIDYKNGSNPMGSQVTSAGVPTLSLSVTDADGEVVTGIELWGGEVGASAPASAIKTYSNISNFNFSASNTEDIQPNNTTWYYYAVITQEDGNKAVTAPIWYTRNDAILPVTYINFKGAYNHTDGKVYLTWTTAQEFNSKEFIIEKSTDGQTWAAIGKVAAAGNASHATTYAFTDQEPARGNNYYRLNQTDIDGKNALSGIVTIQIDPSAGFMVGPNPAYTTVTIYRVKNNDKTEITLTDLSGQMLKKWQMAGSQPSVTIPVNNLAKGLYLLKLTGAGSTQTEKIVVE